MSKMHFCPQIPSFPFNKTAMNPGLRKHRGRSTHWPERLEERASPRRRLHSRGHWVLPTSAGVCRGLECVFCDISQQLLPKKLNHGFSGSSLVPHLQCAMSLFARKPLRQGGSPPHSKNRAQVKGKGLRMSTNPQVSYHPQMDCSAGKAHEAAPFFTTLFMEFTRQLHTILSSSNATTLLK